MNSVSYLKKRCVGQTFIILIFLLKLNLVFAQNSDEPASISKTYFISNCFVVQKPGVVIPHQFVVISNGLIQEIGPSIKVPFDAQLVKGDSMYVYAGFIDALSHTGIAKPENKERPKITDPDKPPMDVAGITPQYQAAEYYKGSDKSVGDLRSAGFTMTHVMPRGLMLPGKSAVFSTGEGETDKLIVRSNVGQAAQFSFTRSVNPSTVIGVIARFRELYKNAAIAGSHNEKYLLNPMGLQRPDNSKELLALYPVTKRQLPVFFVTPKLKDLHRAISLKEELGFDMVLSDVKQGWTLIDKINKNKISVLLSLDLPEDEKKVEKKDEKKSEKEDEKKSEKEEKEVSEPKDVVVKAKEPKKKEKPELPDPEKDEFDVKKAESQKQYYAQAAEFEKNGVAFGFSALEVKSADIKKNIRKMIENGLSEKAALSALTTVPAGLLGLSSVSGTVEKGKLANLVITDKSYFEEKSSIQYVFVDGIKYDYTSKPKKKKDDSENSGGNIESGTYSYEVNVPGQTQTGKLKLSKDGGNIAVTITNDTSPNDETDVKDLVVDGKSVTFYIINDMGGTSLKIEFDLTFEDKSFEGNVSVGAFGSFPITGELTDGPK